MKNTKLIRVVILLFTLVLFNACDEVVESIDPALIKNIETPNPDCLSPANISGAFTSSTNLTLTWTPADGESSWQIQYGISGFELGSGSLTNATSNSITIPNLVSTNSYDFWIRSVCSSEEFGSWSGPFTIAPPNPNCLTPSGLTVVRNPGNTSATVNWTAGGTETSWQVLYVAAGFSPSVGTTLPATSKPFTVSNLTNESYDFYVRAKCSDNEFSSWSTKVNLAEVNGGSLPIIGYMNANINGIQYNQMKPTYYTFTGLEVGAEINSNVEDDFKYIRIQGNTDPFLTSTDGIEINLFISKEYWHTGTFVLKTRDDFNNTPTGYPYCSMFMSEITLAGGSIFLSPGTLTITEFNSITKRIKGTFSFSYTKEINDIITGPFNVLNGEFEFSLKDDVFIP